MSYSNYGLEIELRNYLERLINDHEIADFWMEDYGVELGQYKMTNPMDNRYILPEYHMHITGATINLEQSQERFRIMIMMNGYGILAPNYKARVSLDMNTGTELDEMEYIEVNALTEEFFSNNGEKSLMAIMENLIKKYYTDWEPEDTKQDDTEEFELSIPEVPDFVDRYIVWQKEHIDKNGGVMPMTNLALLPFEGTEINTLQKWLSENFETFCLAYATGKYNVIDNTEDLFYVRLPMSYPEAEYLYLCRFDKSDFDGFTYYTKLGDKKELKKNKDFHFTETQIREIDEDLLTFSYRVK